MQKLLVCLLCALACTALLLAQPPVTLAADAPAINAADYNNDLWGDLANGDGSIVRVPLIKSKIAKVQSALEALKRGGAMGTVKAIVSEASAVPCVILMGAPAEVTTVRGIVEFVLREQMSMPKYFLDIQVNLRSYTKKELDTIGVNLFPTIKDINATAGASFDNSTRNGTDTYTTKFNQSADATIKIDDIDLNSTDNIGQVLVSGEVVTDNGTPTQMTNVLREPTLLPVNGSTSTFYQTLTSKISVTPTIVNFDTVNPLLTQVKLDVGMKIAVNTGSVQLAGTEAPTYTIKSLNTNRIFRADGKNYYAGTFVADYMDKGRTYIPVLGQIPILKYLFSSETTQLTSKISILFISVRLIPTGF